MEFKSNIPIYLQVIQDIKHKIINGRIPLGGKLPSSRELALEYQVNPNTAARIYNELELAGITYTKRGIGTFVTEDASLIDRLNQELIENLMGEFTEQTRRLGYKDTEIIDMLREYLEKSHGSM